MQYRYLGSCDAGFVQFSRPLEEPVIMPEGEAVEVPDWLGEKLANNDHFEAVVDGVNIVAKKRRKKAG